MTRRADHYRATPAEQLHSTTPVGPVDYLVTFDFTPPTGGRVNDAQFEIRAHSPVGAVRKLGQIFDVIRVTRVMVPVANLDSVIREARRGTEA